MTGVPVTWTTPDPRPASGWLEPLAGKRLVWQSKATPFQHRLWCSGVISGPFAGAGALDEPTFSHVSCFELWWCSWWCLVPPAEHRHVRQRAGSSNVGVNHGGARLRRSPAARRCVLREAAFWFPNAEPASI